MFKTRLIFKTWKIVINETKIKRFGKMIADRIRVYRLRWCVFAAWCVTHRNGNKIKRIALQRVSGF